MKVVCPRCGYEWETRSRRRFIKCPNCYKTFRNPFWGSSTTTTTTTSTTTSTTTTTTAKDLAERIEVEIMDFDPVLWKRLKEVAEEASTPDPSGIEVLVLSKSMFDKVMEEVAPQSRSG